LPDVKDGECDFLQAKEILDQYIYTLGTVYNHSTQTQQLFEQLYNSHKDTSGQSRREKAFDPTKLEHICHVYNQKDGHIRYYRSTKTGKFFSCSMHINEKAEAKNTAAGSDGKPFLRLISDSREVSPTPQLSIEDYDVSTPVLRELTLLEAEKLLGEAVEEGRLSPLVFAKHFGEHGEKKVQISAVIPEALHRRFKWSGQTMEKLIEKGCDTLLTETQSEFLEGHDEL
jgi:hypothetical protein